MGGFVPYLVSAIFIHSGKSFYAVVYFCLFLTACKGNHREVCVFKAVYCFKRYSVVNGASYGFDTHILHLCDKFFSLLFGQSVYKSDETA